MFPISRRRLPVVAAVLLAVVPAALSLLPAVAHEAKCPVCKLDVVQDTPKQDNEVALKLGRKRIEYRCVYCAVTEAETEFRQSAADITILAPSEVKGKPVTLLRKGGTWSVTPPTAVFVARAEPKKPDHRSCAVTYRAFSSVQAARTYLAAHPAAGMAAEPLPLDRFLAAIR